MNRTIALALLVLAALPLRAAATGCAGADPAITSLAVKNVTSNDSLNTYTIVGTVTNLGTKGQASNVLQFVDIYQGGQRLEDRGIPPLASGRSYTFSYAWRRAVDAGNGTTTLRFSIRFTQPSPPGNQDCNTSNDTSRITF